MNDTRETIVEHSNIVTYLGYSASTRHSELHRIRGLTIVNHYSSGGNPKYDLTFRDHTGARLSLLGDNPSPEKERQISKNTYDITFKLKENKEHLLAITLSRASS